MSCFSGNQAHKCHYRSGFTQYVFRVLAIASIRPLLTAVSKKDTQAGEVKASLVLILIQALAFEYQKALCLFRFHTFLTLQDAGNQENPLSNHRPLCKT